MNIENSNQIDDNNLAMPFFAIMSFSSTTLSLMAFIDMWISRKTHNQI